MPLSRAKPSSRLATVLACFLGLLLSVPGGARAQFSGDSGMGMPSPANAPTSGAVEQDGVTHLESTRAANSRNASPTTGETPEPRNAASVPIYVPSEFEKYVQSRVDRSTVNATLSDEAETYLTTGPDGQTVERTRPVSRRVDRIRRFGADLMTDPAVAGDAQDPLPAVPGDYTVKPGDTIALTLWGSVDGTLHLVVDRSGRISLPRVGAISVAGVRNADLHDVIARRVGETFRNFEVSAVVDQVRAVRVFVSGYALRPGSVILNGLGSVLHAIMRAGGPSSAGSFRDIHLRRGGREVAVFDLYDLLLKGERNTDQLVQPDDVIFIGPVGAQVALLGSVNQQAIFEIKPGDNTLDAVLSMAGGFSAVAERGRVAIERLADRDTGHVVELKMPDHGKDVLAAGDIVRVFSAVTALLPKDNQNKRVRVEGEVARPGDYVLPPGSHVSDALRAAGGLTALAFPFGTEFTRETVRLTQQLNYDRALRDLETDMARTQSSLRATSAEELNAQGAAATANARLLARLRQVKPTGRVVLQISPDAVTLPDLEIEDGDALKIPPRGTSVGVFGSVFNTGSFVFEPNHTAGDYLALAGGPTRGADRNSMFLIHANGAVESAMQGSSFWHSGVEGFRSTRVVAGDTIFVPEELNQASFIQDAKDWTQILYQFGLGLAGVKALGL